jgi:hypothetical protein
LGLNGDYSTSDLQSKLLNLEDGNESFGTIFFNGVASILETNIIVLDNIGSGNVTDSIPHVPNVYRPGDPHIGNRSISSKYPSLCICREVLDDSKLKCTLLNPTICFVVQDEERVSHLCEFYRPTESKYEGSDSMESIQTLW